MKEPLIKEEETQDTSNPIPDQTGHNSKKPKPSIKFFTCYILQFIFLAYAMITGVFLLKGSVGTQDSKKPFPVSLRILGGFASVFGIVGLVWISRQLSNFKNGQSEEVDNKQNLPKGEDLEKGAQNTSHCQQKQVSPIPKKLNTINIP
jgi:hypothetical protein